MTNKITKEFLFTELSIKIATLEMKLDKVLEMLNKPEQNVEIQPLMINLKGQVERFNNTPPQWPNESRTDYLKRIGQYVEALSEDESFREELK